MVLVLEGAVETVLHPVGVCLAVDNVILGDSSFPKHDTTPKSSVLILLHQSVCLIRHKVVCGIGAGGTGGKAHEKLDTLIVRSLLEALSPLIKGEACLRQVALGKPCLSRACISVVELNEDIVEGRVGDGIVEVSVRNNALRSRGDQHVRAEFLDVVDELGIVLRLLCAYSGR